MVKPNQICHPPDYPLSEFSIGLDNVDEIGWDVIGPRVEVFGTSHYWALHLIETLTLTKIVIFYLRNGLKFDFGSASTNES